MWSTAKRTQPMTMFWYHTRNGNSRCIIMQRIFYKKDRVVFNIFNLTSHLHGLRVFIKPQPHKPDSLSATYQWEWRLNKFIFSLLSKRLFFTMRDYETLSRPQLGLLSMEKVPIGKSNWARLEQEALLKPWRHQKVASYVKKWQSGFQI